MATNGSFFLVGVVGNGLTISISHWKKGQGLVMVARSQAGILNTGDFH